MKPATEVFSSERVLPANVKQITFAKDQPEYQLLPCVKLPNGDILTKWILGKEERRLIADNQELWVRVKTFNQPLQPLMLYADEPDIGYGEDESLFFYSPMKWRHEQGQSDPYDTGLPPGFRDAIYNDTQIHFGFWDKLKILFGWKVRLELKTYTEKRPGNVQSESTIRVYRQRRLLDGWGTVEAKPADDCDQRVSP